MPASPIIMPDEYIQAGLDTVAVMTARTRVLRPSCRSTGVNLIQSAITVPQTSVSANLPSQRPLVIPWASHWLVPDDGCTPSIRSSSGSSCAHTLRSYPHDTPQSPHRCCKADWG